MLSRQSLYNEFYPFKINRGPFCIQFRKELSYKHYSYLGLLASSNLDYLKKYKPLLTTNFEKGSLFVFKKTLPQDSVIEYFGKGNERGSIFSANKLSERIKQLSDVLKIPVSPVFDEEEINSMNTVDGGLDIVGWLDLMDCNSGKVISFAQCACGIEWYDKQFDIHEAKWRNYLHINQPIMRTLITPNSFRRYDGDWFKKMKIFDCIIIDRYRFLKSLRKRENSKIAMLNISVIEDVVSWNMDYFS